MSFSTTENSTKGKVLPIFLSWIRIHILKAAWSESGSAVRKLMDPVPDLQKMNADQQPCFWVNDAYTNYEK